MESEKPKILIIDDSLTNVVLLNAILSDNGYNIFSAFNVADAFKLIKTESPDLILLDLNMPVLNGFDFLIKIKSDKQYLNIPVIIVTAYCDSVNLEKAMSMGAVEYIEKPIDMDLLIQKISNILNYAYH